MNISNIPNDKRDEEIYLKAYRNAIRELNASFEESGIYKMTNVIITMNNEVWQVNELLGENNG